jgi:hypothetical protein
MERKCNCGSGLYKQPHYDARGIFVYYSCPECENTKKARYRPEIFTDPNYEHDEPIDDDE